MALRIERRARLMGVAVLAAVLTGCAAPGPPPLFPGPERGGATLSEDEVGAIAEVLRLEDHRTFDAAAFSRLLEHPSVEVRRRAATAAGRIGNPAAAELLADALLGQRSASVRADAAFALGELGDTSEVVIRALREAVPLSWAPVREEETTVAVEIVAALGKLGTVESGRIVTEALRRTHPGTGEHARRIAAEALLAAWKGDRPGTRITSIVPFTTVPNPELRWRAAYALMRMGVADAVPPLLPLVHGPEDHRVRAIAARGLAAARADSAGVADSAAVALIRALRDEHPHVRINALGALATYEQAPVDSIARLLRDGDANTAIAAAAALGRLAAEEPLRAAAEDRTLPPPVRGAALAQLGSLDPAAALTIAEAWSTGDFQARYQAARSLAVLTNGDQPPTGTEALIGTLARDDDARVAIAALEARAALGDSAAPAERARELVRPTPAVPRDQRDEDWYRDIVRRYIAGPMGGEGRPRAVIRTTLGGSDRTGEIVVELRPEEAPLTVANFIGLARDGYYDAGVWHRVVPNFVLQDGAPGGYATGGPGWAIRDEINRIRYSRGTMGMALSGPDTGGSQWFITHSPHPHLDGGYTVFGRVVDGMDAADAVTQGDVIHSIRVDW